MMALVVAGTCHTLVVRWPGLAGCGTRVNTIPDALAAVDELNTRFAALEGRG